MGDSPASDKAMTAESTRRMIDLLRSIPHGVIAMSGEIEGLVETSTNLANVALDQTALIIGTSQRSSVMSRLEEIATRMESIARPSGGETQRNDGYPAWQPRLDSALLEQCREVYRRLFSKEPVVEVIHAGLECGIIGDIYPQLDMISFGPTIRVVDL